MSPIGIYRPSEIREVRTRLGLTQAKLAELVGVTQAYIAKIEAGESDPRVSTLERITQALERVSSKSVSTTVERIMSSPILSVKPTDPVEKAIKIMETRNISQLPVVGAGVQVGSVSETTLLRHMSSGRDISAMLKQEISELMDDPFPTIGKGEEVRVLYPLLERSPAVLIADRGRMVGIVTKADLFKLREYAG
jgi:predicted transcriptional regulator